MRTWEDDEDDISSNMPLDGPLAELDGTDTYSRTGVEKDVHAKETSSMRSIAKSISSAWTNILIVLPVLLLFDEKFHFLPRDFLSSGAGVANPHDFFL